MRTNSYELFRQTCLLGRVDKALKLSKKLNLKGLSQKQRINVDRIVKRFSSNKVIKISTNESLDQVIHFYQDYWHKSLLNLKRKDQHEKVLVENIRNWLKENNKIKANSKNWYLLLKKAIEKMGYHCITGKVSHLHELEIWKTEFQKKYTVHLIDGNQKVKVQMISDFLVYGWYDYATCGAAKVGGWAKEDLLYCNAKEYNMKSEKFKVSFLTHEAQHFSDYKKFKKLDAYALEYRAKLAEIISSQKTTKKLVLSFKNQSHRSRISYHHYAAYKVVSNLGSVLDRSSTMIRHQASQLLAEDSKNRTKTGLNSI